MDNVEILNQVRDMIGTTPYQQYVPIATKNNIAEVMDVYLDPRMPHMFEELTGAMNRIAQDILMNPNNWRSFYSSLKVPGLAAGESVEELGVNLLKSYDYDFRHSGLFGFHPIKFLSALHSRDYANFTPVTTSKTQYSRIVSNGDDLQNILSVIISTITTSDEAKYQDTVQEMIASKLDAQEIDYKHIDLTLPIPTKTDTDAFIFWVKKTLDDWETSVYNQKSNAWHIKRGLPSRMDVLLLVDSTLDAAIDINSLAPAFNAQYVRFNIRTHVVAGFNNKKVHAILCEQSANVKFIYLRDTVYEMGQFYDFTTRSTLIGLHHQGIVSSSPQALVRAFGEDPDSTYGTITYTMTGITANWSDCNNQPVDTYTYGSRNNPVSLNVLAVGTVEPDNPLVILPSERTVKVVAKTAGVDVDPSLTYVSESGDLHVQPGLADGVVLTANVKSAYINPETGKKSSLTTSKDITIHTAA